MEKFVSSDWPSRMEAAGSVASTSCSAASVPGSSPSHSNPPATLEEQGRMLTGQIVQLKFDIAEQRGKQEELNLDWRKLHTEQSACQNEIVDIDKECDAIRAETDEAKKETTKAQEQLDEIMKEQSPELKDMEDAKNEYDAAQAELRATEEEMDKVKSAGETLRASIEDLKGKASQISCDRSRLAKESEGVNRENEEFREEIARMKQFLLEAKSAESANQAELTCIRKDSAKISKQNEVLESKIAWQEKKMAKKQ